MVDRSGSQAGGGLVPGGQSCWRGLGEGRVVRQAGIWYREGYDAGGAWRGTSSQAGGGLVAGSQAGKRRTRGGEKGLPEGQGIQAGLGNRGCLTIYTC